MSEDKIEYLGMIQGVIDRMASNSVILKGFAATVITGISAISFTEVNQWILLLSVVPVLSFFALDVYYLRLERKLRYLYNMVRSGTHAVDFSMDASITREDMRAARCRRWDCIISPSIWVFYFPAVVILAIVVMMKFRRLL